jgi:hypothetical protein
LSGRGAAVEEVEASFDQAIETARQQSAKWFELRATVDKARYWSSDGRHAEAYKLLSKSYGWFTEGVETLDLKTAKSVIEMLSVTQDGSARRQDPVASLPHSAQLGVLVPS